MNYFSSKIIITAPTDTLKTIKQSRYLSEESLRKYCNDNNSSFCLCDIWPLEFNSDKTTLTTNIRSRGLLNLTFFTELLVEYPTIIIDIKVSSMGAHWSHFVLTSDESYEIYDEDDFRNEVEDFIAFSDIEKNLLKFEIAHRYMVPEFYTWSQRLDVDDAEKELGVIIPFPDDLVPDGFKAAWSKDPDAFKKAITTLADSWKQLEELCAPETFVEPSQIRPTDKDVPF